MAKKTLLPSNGSTEMQLPDIHQDTDNIVSTGNQSAYGCFVTSKSKNFSSWLAAIPGLQEPDVVYVRPAPEPPIKIDPFKFCFIAGKQFWCRIDNEGQLLEVKADRQPFPYVESIESVLLLFANDTIYPAKFTWRSTKCQAAQLCHRTLQEAATDEWAKKGAEYQKSLQAPKPYLRFTATVTCRPKTSRSSGYKYYAASASIAPTGPNEWATLGQFLHDEENMSGFMKVVDSYRMRVAEVEKMIK